MAISHLLEDFSVGASSDNVLSLMSEVALEDQRLASFEKGYSAGWEDAFAAQEQDQARIIGKLAENLGDLSFTYQEALSELTGSVQPVFQSLVDLVLPDIMARTFGQHIVEQLCEMVQERASGPASLIVPVGVGPSLSPILAQDMPMPVKITEDAKMDRGCAFLRLGTSERVIDTTALLHSIRDSIDAFTSQTIEELKNA